MFSRHESLKSLVIIIDPNLHYMTFRHVKSFYLILPRFQSCTFNTIDIVGRLICLFLYFWSGSGITKVKFQYGLVILRGRRLH